MFRLLSISAVVLWALWGLQATAQATELAETRDVSLERLGDSAALLQGFDVANVTALAETLGFSATAVAVEGDYPVIILRDARGVPLMVQPMACSGPGVQGRCKGLLFLMMFEGPVQFPGLTLAQVNRFNAVQYYGRGHVTPGRQGILTRLVVGDYGVTRGTLAVELVTFRAAGYNFARYVSQNRMSPEATSAAGPGVQGFAGLPGRGETGLDMPELEGLVARWQRAGLLKDTGFDRPE